MGTRRPVLWDRDTDLLEYRGDTGAFIPVAKLTDLRVFVGAGDDATVGLVPRPQSTAASTRYLCEDGTWSTPSGGGGGGGGDTITVNGAAVVDADFDDSTPAAPAAALNVKWQKTGSGPADVSAYIASDGVSIEVAAGAFRRSALTGDVTASAGSNATTIANNAVSDAKLRDSAAVSVIGRSANSAGDPADIAAGANDTFFGRMSNALGFFGLQAIVFTLLTNAGDILTRTSSTLVRKGVTGNNGATLTEDSSSTDGLAWTPYVNPSFGDGSDGNVTYVADQVLAAQLDANNLTLASTVKIKTNGWLLRVKGTLTGDSSNRIHFDGNPGVANIGGASVGSQQVGGSTAGRNGLATAGNGLTGNTAANSWPASVGTVTDQGDGGAGGNAGIQTGGAKGDATAIAANSGIGGDILYQGRNLNGGTILLGGAGGGTGSNSAVGGSSGGSGAGGGVCLVWAYIIVGNIAFGADGGAGGNATASGGNPKGGGGGGGGGACVVLTHYLGSSVPTLTANGGAAGLGVSGGSDGTAGIVGYTEIRLVA